MGFSKDFSGDYSYVNCVFNRCRVLQQKYVQDREKLKLNRVPFLHLSFFLYVLAEKLTDANESW